MRIRPTVRVILLDPAGRVLLLHFHNRLTAEPPTLWATPGGGIEAGETMEAAARREIREETGIADLELGPVLRTEDIATERAGEALLFRMTFILARTATTAIDLSGCLPDEKDDILDVRWWTAEALAAGAEAFRPLDLPDLVRTVTV
ncbi:MAG: NUDIX domain-containing protein [Proteobacteria bacterium]|nr:NUDIX domain-containing protein [Pseudomonadota bacterium]